MEGIQELWDQGYSTMDVVVTIISGFRVVKTLDKMPEYTKLEFVKVFPHPMSDL